MEDGVLIGPAPYSAPAAYYFPMLSRMTAVEVTKGPGAIKYGPNTVAGTLNMVTRPVPYGMEAGADIAVGTDGYGKLHGYYGNSVDQLGYLFEALHIKTDGFKELDGGGDTGFNKSDVMAKFGLDLDTGNTEQRLELKLAYAEEESDETYLGLTDSDFAQKPERRYAASQLDRMDWEHSQIQLTYDMQSQWLDLTARLYRHDFERSWFKVNRFVSSQGGSVPALQEILRTPDDEQYQIYYQVLSGQQDASIREILELGDNAREYYSQGAQVDLARSLELAGITHRLEAGVRFHQDEIQRNHTVDNFLMRSGILESTGEATRATTTNLEQTDAWSVYVQDNISLGDWQLAVGTRGEFIDGYYQNRAEGAGQDWQRKSHRIWLPSISAFYALSPDAGVFGGVHKGYVPVSPLQDVRIRPEESVNYELGWRYANGAQRAELVGFYNRFSNLSESCSFSTAASCATEGELDQNVNGGKVVVYGVEAIVAGNHKFNSWLSLPWSLTYTFTESEFKQQLDSDFTLWGQVEPGDEVPYLPDHVLTLTLGLQGNDWQMMLLGNYRGEMLEAAGEGVALSGLSVPANTVWDINASYDLDNNSSLYVKVDNLFDSVKIASRRPFGARPGKPRQAFIGYKYRF